MDSMRANVVCESKVLELSVTREAARLIKESWERFSTCSRDTEENKGNNKHISYVNTFSYDRDYFVSVCNYTTIGADAEFPAVSSPISQYIKYCHIIMQLENCNNDQNQVKEDIYNTVMGHFSLIILSSTLFTSSHLFEWYSTQSSTDGQRRYTSVQKICPFPQFMDFRFSAAQQDTSRTPEQNKSPDLDWIQELYFNFQELFHLWATEQRNRKTTRLRDY